MTDYKYKVSFVIPVYNVENYLAETVESILAQTMGFEANCEIIFVNDGSPDNSEEVCLRYQQQFPNNIKYFKQKNVGPGAARNRGIVEAKGKYISLLDSDDKISADTLGEVYKFFEKHHDDIDIVSIKQIFFEARTGDHPLNYKFKNNRIIDLVKDFDQIQMSVTSSFFKNEVLQKHHFKESVGRYAEDSHLMGRILLDKQRFGVVSKPTYFYRKRSDEASSLDATKTDKFWYLETPKRAWLDLFDYVEKSNQTIPRFVQYMVMYDLGWRIKQSTQTVLSGSEMTEYKQIIYNLFTEVSDDIVMAQRNITSAHKIFVLSKKYSESVIASAERRGRSYFYRGTKIYDLDDVNAAANIEFISTENKELTIEGFYDGILFGKESIQIGIDSERVETSRIDRPHGKIEFLGETVAARNGFIATISATSNVDIRFFRSGQAKPLPILTHRFSRLSQSVANGYCVIGSYIVKKRTDRLIIRKYGHFRRLGLELAFWGSLAKRLKLEITRQAFETYRNGWGSNSKHRPQDFKWAFIPAKSVARNVYVIFFRLAYFIAKPFYRRPIWLVSDRILEADDNGEVFYRYLRANKDNISARFYFVISKRSSEFNRLKRYGSVVNYHGLYYKLLFLLSSKVISSEALDHTINAFGGRMGDLVDLYNFDFIFLQHGIIRDDISGWLNKYDKNINLFITSVRPEYDSIVNGDYGYGKDVVRLTGLPRFDNLISEPKNKLIFMPTWRLNLAGKVNPMTGGRLGNPNFKTSEYYNFWQRLMNDERLQLAMNKVSMKGEFYLHHSFENQIGDFEGNENFKIMQMPHDYPRAKREGDLLVTDYSSVALDFAYMTKPIIYTQFDLDTYYKNYVGVAGYLDYERDGLGPVAYNYEDTVKQILKMIDLGCIMEPMYRDRLEKFFAYSDQKNSERVYDAILEMDEKR